MTDFSPHPLNLRVLIAEDDDTVRQTLSEVIDGEPGFKLVGAARDAAEAIALATTEQPDVVLVDVRMPGGGGVTAARGIRRHSQQSKVIALSGQGDRSTVFQMLEAGAVGYLLKGGAVQEILEAIKRASDGYGSLSTELTGAVIEGLAEQLHADTRDRHKHDLAERRIRRVIEGEQPLSMALQPIVSLCDGVAVGAEALARFAGPPHRTPSAWFAEAAVVDLRETLELLAVSKAVEALDYVPEGAYVTFNVSPTSLTRKDFPKLFTNADTSRLIVEITEHAPIVEYARLDSNLEVLRKMGMRLAIDDAGAGYSSLRHILELKPDLIKLDISLIRDIDNDGSKQALAAGLISFADKIGATVIAEGIERPGESSALVELGVRLGQGYLLGKPALCPSPLSATKTVATA